ncbi:MAG: DUF5060 domain-containing protein, partial [Bacteroidales bacterium]|nr:DUF5060 domain-containing protein [Bacteroidales bacterium]
MKVKNIFAFILLGASLIGLAGKTPDVEKWGMIEITFQLAAKINPSENIKLQAIFISEQDSIRINGFYDGNRI